MTIIVELKLIYELRRHTWHMMLIYAGQEDEGSTNRDRYQGRNVWAQGTRGHNGKES